MTDALNHRARTDAAAAIADPGEGAAAPAALKPHPIFRLMPSLTDVAFLMPLVFLFTRLDGVRTLLGDGDTGWHVRTGEWILAHGRVPDTDLFSFTKPGQPWFAWEWLWDVVFAWIHQRAGLGGVVMVSMLLICFTFAMLFRLVNRRCGNPMVAIALTVVATAGSTLHWLARPHLFTMFFVVVFLSILDRVREGRVRLLWWLPAITILWTNLHGGFPVGIVILGAYGGGELARALVAAGREERVSAARAAIPYFAAAAGCLAASLVNPYFYHLHVHIWQYLRDPFLTEHINEFQSANFRMATASFFEAMLVLAVCAGIWHGMRRNLSEVLLLAGWAQLGLLMARNIPIFMIVAAPVVAPAVVAWIGALREASLAGWLRSVFGFVETAGAEIGPVDRLWRVHVVCAAAFCVVALAMASPTAGRTLKPEFDPTYYPAGALAVLQDPALHIFSRDQWSDYLIYRLSPGGTKVFIDGRSDFYGAKFDQDYVDVLNVKYDWEQTVARYGVDTILLPTDDSLAGAIKESSRWRVVYDDGHAIVFRPSADAASRGEQSPTSTTGGEVRDLSITQTPNVISRDHVPNQKGVSRL